MTIKMTKGGSAKHIRLHKNALKAMHEAVKEVIAEHMKNGLLLAVWKNGKVVWVSARSLK